MEREARARLEPEDLSGNLLVQFGCATEDLNRRWFERETGRRLGAVQRFVRHPRIDWMGATLDGLVEEETAVFEAKFMLPWSFTEESAAEKHMPQLQHNMLVTGARAGVPVDPDRRRQSGSLIEVEADPLYQTVLLQVERIFWRCVRTGEVPKVFGAEPPRAKAAGRAHRRHGVPRTPGPNTPPSSSHPSRPPRARERASPSSRP